MIAGVGFEGGSRLSRLFTDGLSLTIVGADSKLVGGGRSLVILLKENIILLGIENIVRKRDL